MEFSLKILIAASLVGLTLASDEKNSLLTKKSVEDKLTEYATSFTEYLENFNDRHLGRTPLGRLINYEKIKPSLKQSGRSKSNKNKKMAMAMMPMVFHIGATSTWMILTALMAAKSVAIGFVLLVFKIAVSSAKLSSFFTLLKAKHHQPEHSWTPHHHDHHGYERSLTVSEPHYTDPWQSSYKNNELDWSPEAPHAHIPTHETHSAHETHDHTHSFIPTPSGVRK